MQNPGGSDSTDDIQLRKRNSESGLENNPPMKMGKQNRGNQNNVRIRSAENILKDIKEAQQKRKENINSGAIEGHVSFLTETTISPPTDMAIPQKALDRYLRFLAHDERNADKHDFWRRQFDDTMSDETIQIIDDCEKLTLCPICQAELPKSDIEAHADECAAQMFHN